MHYHPSNSDACFVLSPFLSYSLLFSSVMILISRQIAECHRITCGYRKIYQTVFFWLSIDLGSVDRLIHSFSTLKQLIFVNYVQYLRYLRMRTPFSIVVCTCLRFIGYHRHWFVSHNHQLNDGHHRVLVIFTHLSLSSFTSSIHIPFEDVDYWFQKWRQLAPFIQFVS